MSMSMCTTKADLIVRPNESRAGLAFSMAVCLLMAGCTEGATTEAPAQASVGGNRPPVVQSAKIIPASMSQSDRASLEIQAEDPDHETVNYLVQWYADDAPLAGQTGVMLTGEMLRRGQRISAEITPTDGRLKGQPFRTASILVGNTPPRVSAVTLVPQAGQPGTRLDVQAEATDPDHDRVDVTYRWFKNSDVVKDGDEPFLDTTGFKPGDSILVEVATRDLTSAGNSMRSEVVVLGNGLPTIISTPPTGPASGDRYEYIVKAVDPDGDHLAYHLETAPSGMVISQESGRIDWQIPSDKPGTYHVKVAVNDGRGGSALQEFDLTLTPVAGSVKPAGT